MLEEWSNGINRKTKRQSTGHWRTVGYYGKLFDLAAYLLNYQIETPTGTLTEQIPALIAEIKAAEARITEILKAK